MSKIDNIIGGHITHCCIIHGCKYGDPACPVENKTYEQEYTCERCGEDGIYSVAEIKMHLLLISCGDKFKKMVEDFKEAVANDGMELFIVKYNMGGGGWKARSEMDLIRKVAKRICIIERGM